MKNKEILKQAKLALARKELFYYAHLKAPEFYTADREYLKRLCRVLADFIEDDADVLVVNLPPRHGKSRTAQLLVEWSLGNNQKLKIMTGSYNETVATQFSKGVRNSIQEVKADEEKIVYSDIFPGVTIKAGDGASNLWSLTEGHQNYLATSPTGTATGFGADLLIIDDIIKNAEEANNANILEKHWSWFTNTMLSRIETGGKIIVIMTRWHSKDLAGRIVAELPEKGYSVKQFTETALQKDGKMLCDEILSYTEYQKKIKTMGKDIASANYQQKPIDIKGRLYTKFKLYEDIPKNEYGESLFETIKLYSDTADQGDDYLCNIIYGIYKKQAYILDVYYTKAPMEITEKETAKRIIEYDVRIADIESNNGGRGFARAVGKILNSKGWNRTKIRPFHQTKNKEARILTNATWVMENIYYPKNFKEKWPEFYSSMYEYQRDAKNQHDDAQDAITGVAEKTMRGNIYSFE